MKCEACDQKPATVHVTTIVNKKKREEHLCDECAREKGVTVKPIFADPAEKQSQTDKIPAPTQSELEKAASTMKGAIEKAGPGALQRVEDLSGIACPVCGLTFAEFRASGRLGCAKDYDAFKRGLVPLLEKIHGTVDHKGKVPAHVGERIERQRKVGELRQKLNQAIQREEYELAASLRDEIYALEESAPPAPKAQEKGNE